MGKPTNEQLVLALLASKNETTGGARRKKSRGLAAMPLRQLYNLQTPDTTLGDLPFLSWAETEIRAKAGDVVAARILLLLASAALRQRPPVSGESRQPEFCERLPVFVANYLTDALAAIAKGTPANTALNLRRNTGSAKFWRDDWIVYLVNRLQLAGSESQASYDQAADLLDEFNFPGPRKGKTWDASTVNKIVTKRRGK